MNTIREIWRLIWCKLNHIKYWKKHEGEAAIWWQCQICGQTHGMEFKKSEIEDDTSLV